MVSLCILFLVVVREKPAWGLLCYSAQGQAGVIRGSSDREGETMSQDQGQPGKSSEQVRIGRDRAGDQHSYYIAGAGTDGLEMS